MAKRRPPINVPPDLPDVDPMQFAWLADAPLFIDATQIERFYDAVVRPTYREGAVNVTTSEGSEKGWGGEGSGEVKAGITGGFLKYLFGGTAEAKLGGKVTGQSKSSEGHSQQAQWLPIHTPQRQLEQLIFSYLEYVPHRVLNLSSQSCEPLFDVEVSRAFPRAIVVLDLPSEKEARSANHPLTKFIPMAAELPEVGVKLLYTLLKKAPERRPSPAPEPPATMTTASDPQQTGTQRETDFWLPYVNQFDSWDAMKALEDGVGGARIRWIDFRIPVRQTGTTEEERTIHLHFTPAGEYDTGVFAFNLVQRAFIHGVRLVATLKSGADLNVLAVYEK